VAAAVVILAVVVVDAAVVILAAVVVVVIVVRIIDERYGKDEPAKKVTLQSKPVPDTVFPSVCQISAKYEKTTGLRVTSKVEVPETLFCGRMMPVLGSPKLTPR
jgi:hypothetical protein